MKVKVVREWDTVIVRHENDEGRAIRMRTIQCATIKAGKALAEYLRGKIASGVTAVEIFTNIDDGVAYRVCAPELKERA